jgi:hypothetical protein
MRLRLNESVVGYSGTGKDVSRVNELCV